MGNTYILDTETDGLDATKIWCGVILNKGTRQVWRFINDGSNSIYSELRKFFSERPHGIFIGHNIVSFDGPVLARLCHFDWPYDRTVDSLVLSYLYNPALAGGHSLEAYGQRLGFPKVLHEDWSKYTPEMLHRCEVDVELTEKVYDELCARMRKIGYSELSAEIEHKIRKIVDEQQHNGFYFNVSGAKDLLQYLRGRESDLATPIQKLFPATLEEMGTYTRRKRKDGSDYSSYERHVKEYDKVIDNADGTYSCFDFVDFNIGSPQQRLERLQRLGYQPTAKTKKGNPRIDEDSLLEYAKLSGLPEIGLMAEWLVCNGRANMVQTWLNNVGSDSRIHGKVLTCAATTRRMIHNHPNTGNIPHPKKAKYGKEVRELWGVEPDKGLVEVGIDASSLETAGLLHYLNNPKATEVLLQEKPNDIHTSNSRKLTKRLKRDIDREWGAKTSWYAWIYGAYPKKLGEIVKGPPSDGDIVIATFFDAVPGLKRLMDSIQKEWLTNKGRLQTIDGGHVLCPSMNAALNYKIQSLGAIVMKLAAIILDSRIKELGLRARLLGSIHDEWQFEVPEQEAETLGKVAVESISHAAEQLGFNVHLSGEYKIGKNWSECH